MVKVRAAVEGDSLALWEWRNDPFARANSLTNDEVSFARHAAWYASSLASQTRRIYIGLDHELDRIGMVRFDRDDERATVSINLAPHARGHGLSAPLLAAAIKTFHAEYPAVVELVAEIKESNVSSLRLFASAGFAPRALKDSLWTYIRSD